MNRVAVKISKGKMDRSIQNIPPTTVSILKHHVGQLGHYYPRSHENT